MTYDCSGIPIMRSKFGDPLTSRPDDGKFYFVPAEVWNEMGRHALRRDWAGVELVAKLNAKRMFVIVPDARAAIVQALERREG